MSDSQGRVSGNQVNHSAYDRMDTIGSDVNLLPHTRKYDNYYERKIFGVTEKGSASATSTMPKYEMVDNSSDFHSGKYTIMALNSIDLEAANGGINLGTSGNISIQSDGSIISIQSPNIIQNTSEIVKLVATKELEIIAEEAYADVDELTLTGNVKIGKNLQVHGSAFVNGELYASHITSPVQMNFTEMSSELSGILNPNQNFYLSGSMVPGTPTQILATVTVSSVPEFVPVGSTFTMEITIPNPINIVSVYGLGGGMNPVAQEADVYIFPHNHTFKSISWSSTNSSSEFWEEAKNVDSKEAGEAKNNPFGVPAEQFKNIVNQYTDSIKNSIKNTIKRVFKL